jgi:hypothetical protein
MERFQSFKEEEEARLEIGRRKGFFLPLLYLDVLILTHVP